jgi:hypothetical protein
MIYTYVILPRKVEKTINTMPSLPLLLPAFLLHLYVSNFDGLLSSLNNKMGSSSSSRPLRLVRALATTDDLSSFFSGAFFAGAFLQGNSSCRKLLL